MRRNPPSPNDTNGIISSTCGYLSGSLLLLWFMILSLILVKFSVHFVEEGNVGVYYRSGRLLPIITSPGLHYKIPFIDTFELVQTTVQTDKVTNIPCGTAGGVVINFGQIEVVNRLKPEYVYDTVKNYTTAYDKVMIFDRVHHLINQFCSSHTLQEIYIDLFSTVDDELGKELQSDANKWCPGLEIISVRVTKPILPSVILSNYEAMEAEKTKLLIATQAQHVTEKYAETEKKKAVIQAEKEAAVSLINLNQKIHEKLAHATIAQIENEMFHNKSKARADAINYHRYKEAVSNERLLTPAYLTLQAIEQLSKSTRIYFGPSIPSTLVDISSFLSSMPSGSSTVTHRNTLERETLKQDSIHDDGTTEQRKFGHDKVGMDYTSSPPTTTTEIIDRPTLTDSPPMVPSVPSISEPSPPVVTEQSYSSSEYFEIDDDEF